MKDSSYMVPALLRGLKILELVSKHPEGLSAPEMESHLGLPPATLYRMISTLVRTGYLVKDGGECYRLTRRLLSIGYRSLDGQGLVERALPQMRTLRDASGESVLIASLYGNEGVVLEQCVACQPVMFSIRIGHHFPLHTAAPGKALVAFLPEEQRASIMNTLVFAAFSRATIRTRKAYEEELARVRKEGVAYDRGEELKEIRCVAAPVFDYRNYPVAALSIGGPVSRLGPSRLKRLAQLVKKAASQII